MASYISKMQLTGGTYLIKDAALRDIVNAVIFSKDAQYYVGDYVYYGSLDNGDYELYRCVKDHKGDWVAADFVKVTITSELNGIKKTIAGGVHYRGIFVSGKKVDGTDITALEDGIQTKGNIVVNTNTSISPQDGDIVISGSGEKQKEFIASSQAGEGENRTIYWNELGSTSKLGILAGKDYIVTDYDRASIGSSAAVVDNVYESKAALSASAVQGAVTGVTVAAHHMKDAGGRAAAVTGLTSEQEGIKAQVAAQTIDLQKKSVVTGYTGAAETHAFIDSVVGSSASYVVAPQTINIAPSASAFATGLTSKEEKAFVTSVASTSKKLVKASAYGVKSAEDSIKVIDSNEDVAASKIDSTSNSSFINSVTLQSKVATGLTSTGVTAGTVNAMMASASVDLNECLTFGYAALDLNNQTSTSANALTAVTYTGVTASKIGQTSASVARLDAQFSYANGSIAADGAGAEIVDSVSIGATANAIVGIDVATAQALTAVGATASYSVLRAPQGSETGAIAIVNDFTLGSTNAVVKESSLAVADYGVGVTAAMYAANDAQLAVDAAATYKNLKSVAVGATAEVLQSAAFEAVAPLSSVSVAAPTVTLATGATGDIEMVSGVTFSSGVNAVTGLTYASTGVTGVAYPL